MLKGIVWPDGVMLLPHCRATQIREAAQEAPCRWCWLRGTAAPYLFRCNSYMVSTSELCIECVVRSLRADALMAGEAARAPSLSLLSYLHSPFF